MANGHGGKRPGSGGAGKPKGTLWPSTIAKIKARELVRKEITKHLPALIEAQVANGKGLKYLVIRDKKTGKFSRVTGDMLDALEGSDEDVTVEIWAKDPNVQAFTMLAAYALDKPAEQEIPIMVRSEDVADRVARLAAARQRVQIDAKALLLKP